VNAGLSEILIVTGGSNAGDFLRLLGNGREFGLKHLDYTYQEAAGGIAEALGLAEDFADGDKTVLMLGDNIIQGNIRCAAERFKAQDKGAKVLVVEVENPQSYGIAEIQGNRIVGIVEKPTHPKSNLAVTGIYMYDGRVFDIVRQVKPSDRGELEITDVNNAYIEVGEMTFEYLKGWWADAGESIDYWLRANNMVKRDGANRIDL